MANFTISVFKCPYCGLTMTVPRNKARNRGKNHIKTLYCVKCKRDVVMLENREFDFAEKTLAEKEAENNED